LSQNAIRELCLLPELAGNWVAIDPRGCSNDRITPLRFSLRSGAVVVDADPELDVLCARLRASKETSLTIVYAGSR
jgi:hypothetical protein